MSRTEVTSAWAPTTPQISAASFGGTGYDGARSVTVDSSGNTYITGFFFGTVDFGPGVGTQDLTSFGIYDVFVSKLNSLGELVWVKQLGGVDWDDSGSLAVDSTGNVYITGYFQGTADFDPGAGTQNLTTNGYKDAFVTKLNSLGEFVWAKQFGETGNDVGNSVVVDVLGNVYSTGWFKGTVDFDPGVGVQNLTSTGIQEDVFVAKLTSMGELVWAKQFGGTGNESGNSVVLDALGNVYSTGSFTGTADFDPGIGVQNLTSAGSQDVFVAKLNSMGELVWAKQFGGTGMESGKSVTVDALGNVYSTGSFTGTADFDPGIGVQNFTSGGFMGMGTNTFLSKLNSSGEFVWAKQFSSDNSSGGESLVVDTLGNVLSTGSFSGATDFDPGAGIQNLSSAGNKDVYVSKLNSMGEFVWAKKFGGSNSENGVSIAVDVLGNVFSAGIFSGTTDFDPGVGVLNFVSAGGDDAFVSRLNPSGDALESAVAVSTSTTSTTTTTTVVVTTTTVIASSVATLNPSTSSSVDLAEVKSSGLPTAGSSMMSFLLWSSLLLLGGVVLQLRVRSLLR